ncbi:MAG: glutamine-hydrolyzing carbamoyl-phosphate synthase small subunit [Planctomycetaceae bacterium]
MTGRPAKLALANGMVFTGRAFGADGEVDGEVVFNTSMTGYQEILTDPSYTGQIVTMTYPLIGNYGVNSEDVESRSVFLKGFVIRELCDKPSNYRSEENLDTFLKRHNIIGIQGIDTRALVRQIRTHGAMKGILSTIDQDDESLVRKAQDAPGLVGRDLVSEVIPDAPAEWDTPLGVLGRPMGLNVSAADETSDGPHVVAMDFGMKWNIARYLRQFGCRVTVVPGTTTADEILAMNPDGVFLSNGPGDPEPLTYAIDTIRTLIGKKPVFGICLGLQLLGLAFGGRTYKLRFGHRGANQPVLNCRTGRVEITSQNHGFAVDTDSLPDDIEVTHLNLNDNTVEGLRHKEHPVFGVQYHPEAAAGPHDSHYLFAEFVELMKGAAV